MQIALTIQVRSINESLILISSTYALLQDPVYQVRMTFLDKLVTLLSKGKLSAQYNMVPFLAVHDPEADVKGKAQAYVLFALRAMPKRKTSTLCYLLLC